MDHKTTNTVDVKSNGRGRPNGQERQGASPDNQSARVNFPFSYILSSFINSEVPLRRNTNAGNHSFR